MKQGDTKVNTGRRGKLAGAVIAASMLALAIPAASNAALTVPKPEPQQITTPQPVQSVGNTWPLSQPTNPAPHPTPYSPGPPVQVEPMPGPEPAVSTDAWKTWQLTPGDSACLEACMRDWDRQMKSLSEHKEWSVRYWESQRTVDAMSLADQLRGELEEEKKSYAEFRSLWADKKATAAKDAQDQAAYRQAMNEYFDEHNDEYEYGLITGPAAGSFLGLLQPVFDLLQSTPKATSSSAPVGHAMPESPAGEPLAAVSIRTLLDPPDKNSSKF